MLVILAAISIVNLAYSGYETSYYGEKFADLLLEIESAKSLEKENQKTANLETRLKKELNRVLDGYHVPAETTKRRFDTVDEFCRVEGNCFRQHVISYREARRKIFFQLDTKRSGKEIYVEDVYCHERFDLSSNRMPNHTIVNVEHSWPQSKFVSRYPKNMQKSDLHHLFPSNSRANSRRGNYPFGEVSNQRPATDGCNDSVYGPVRTPSDEHRYSSTYFEPAHDHKGNVARAMFYFSIRYEVQIDPLQEYYFRKWHLEDPVDDLERSRNEKIFKIQKNRNPFVDHPYLVSTIRDF
jgi:endonuclease I